MLKSLLSLSISSFCTSSKPRHTEHGTGLLEMPICNIVLINRRSVARHEYWVIRCGEFAPLLQLREYRQQHSRNWQRASSRRLFQTRVLAEPPLLPNHQRPRRDRLGIDNPSSVGEIQILPQ